MLLDSNILIYACLPDYQSLLKPYLTDDTASVSIVTKIEVLGYHRLVENDKNTLIQLFEHIDVIQLGNEVTKLAIHLKQQQKLSLGDAIIASTALIFDKTLITRNTSDFAWITNLKLYNPIDN